MATPVLYAHLKYFDIERAISQADEHPYYRKVAEWFTYDPVNKSYIPISSEDLRVKYYYSKGPFTLGVERQPSVTQV